MTFSIPLHMLFVPTLSVALVSGERGVDFINSSLLTFITLHVSYTHFSNYVTVGTYNSVVDKSLFAWVGTWEMYSLPKTSYQLDFCSEDISHVPTQGGIYLLRIRATRSV